MNQDDIVRMARESGHGVQLDDRGPWGWMWNTNLKMMTDFAKLVAAAEREKLKEPIRIRIMSAALDCADEGDTESYNTVKVMCSDVLEMLNEPR